MATEDLRLSRLLCRPSRGFSRSSGPAFSARLAPWATFLRPLRRAPEPDRDYSNAYVPWGERAPVSGVVISRYGRGEGLLPINPNKPAETRHLDPAPDTCSFAPDLRASAPKVVVGFYICLTTGKSPTRLGRL